MRERRRVRAVVVVATSIVAAGVGACTGLLGDFSDGTANATDASGGGMDQQSPDVGPADAVADAGSDAVVRNDAGDAAPVSCAMNDGGCTPVPLCTYANAAPVNTSNDDQLVVIGNTAYWTPSLEPTDGGDITIAATLSCNTTATPSTPPPAATVVFSEVDERSGSGVSASFADWVPAGVITGDSTQAYWLVYYSHGTSNIIFRAVSQIDWSAAGGIAPDGGTPFDTASTITTGFGDPTSTQGLYFYTPNGPTLFRGGIGAQAATCIDRTDAGTVDDGIGSNNVVLIADDSNGVLMTAQVSSGGCTTPTTIATGTRNEDSLAISHDGAVFATEIGGDIYICSTATGCSASLPATALISSVAASTGEGSTGGTNNTYGMAFDEGTAAGGDLNLYWIGSSATGGLVRCAVKMTNGVGSCTSRTVLVPSSTGLQPTSSLAVDSTYVYYLQAGTLFRVTK
jgi:hypothetical protein